MWVNLLQWNLENEWRSFNFLWNTVSFDETKYLWDISELNEEISFEKDEQELEKIKLKWILLGIDKKIFENLQHGNFSLEDLNTLKNFIDNEKTDIRNSIYEDIKQIYQINSKRNTFNINSVIMDDESHDNLKYICEKYDISNDVINNIIERWFISINLQPYNLENILKEWYKSTFFTNHNWWNISFFDQRLVWEKEHNCLFSDVVYWALCTTDSDILYWGVTAWIDEKLKVSTYWPCYIKLKSDINKRCTWTLWDTFSWETLLTYSDCLKARKLLDNLDLKANKQYIDMQIYWWVSPIDIESVHYTVFDFFRKKIDANTLKQIDQCYSICLKYNKDFYLEIPEKFYNENKGDVGELQNKYPNAIIDIR